MEAKARLNRGGSQSGGFKNRFPVRGPESAVPEAEAQSQPRAKQVSLSLNGATREELPKHVDP